MAENKYNDENKHYSVEVNIQITLLIKNKWQTLPWDQEHKVEFSSQHVPHICSRIPTVLP